MLAVPYFEKALYELPDSALSVEAVLSLAARIEADIQARRWPPAAGRLRAVAAWRGLGAGDGGRLWGEGGRGRRVVSDASSPPESAL